MSKDTSGKRGKSRNAGKTVDTVEVGFEGISSDFAGSPDDRRGTSSLVGSPDDR
jgi:hypothetical protein